MLTLIKIMKQKGMMRVISIEFWAPVAKVLILEASSLLAKSLGMSADSVRSSIFSLSFLARKNLLLISYILNLSAGFIELTKRMLENIN